MLWLASACAGSHQYRSPAGRAVLHTGVEGVPELQVLCGDRASASPGGGRTTTFHKHSLARFSHQKLVVWLTMSSKFLSLAEKAFQDTRCTITILTGAKQTVSNFLEQCLSYRWQNSTHSQSISSLKVCQMSIPHVLQWTPWRFFFPPHVSVWREWRIA